MGIYTEAVQKLYVAYFSRPADAAGLTYWEGVVTAAKGDTSAVSAEFAKSQEYKDTFAGQSEYQVINTIYMNLFGRPAEPAALTFWGQNLINKAFTIDTAVTEIAKGAQGSDLTAYNNKVKAATAFSAALDTNSEILGYQGAAANAVAKTWMSGITTDASLEAAIAPAVLAASIDNVVGAGNQGQNYVLTQGQDTLVGTAGNDTFVVNAFNATTGAGATNFSSFDSIDGAAGKDSLTINVVSNGAAAPGTANFNSDIGTVTNVETIVLNQAAADTTLLTAPANALDASKFVGATSITQVGQARTVNNLAASTTAGFTGINTDITVNAAGASATIALTNVLETAVVNVAGATLSAVTVAGSLVDGADVNTTVGPLALSVTAGKDVQTVSVNSALATNLAVVDTGSAATKKVTTVDASTSTGNIAFIGDAETTSIMTGAGADAVTLAAATSKATSTVAAVNASVMTGAGADTIKVDTNAGGLATATGATTVDAGAGDDTVEIMSRSSGKLTVNLGDGADSFKSAVAVNAGDVIDAGAGTDILALSLVGSANIGAFSNFDVFDAVGLSRTLDVDILATKNTVTEFIASGDVGAGAALINVGAGAGFRATADMGTVNTLTLTQKTPGALTVTVDADEGATDPDADIVYANLSTNATSVKAVFDTAFKASITGEVSFLDNTAVLNLGAAAATTMEVVSGGALASNVLNVTGTKITTVTVTGDRVLTVNSATTELTTLDASAATGGLVASTDLLKDTGAIRLGTGVDRITVGVDSNATVGVESIVNMEKAAAAAVGTDATAAAAAQKDADLLSFGRAGAAATDATIAGGAVAKGVLTFTGAGPSDLAAAMLIADAAADTTGEVVVFEYLGNSYVFQQGAGAGIAADDLVVKLVGVTGVTNLAEVGTTDTFFLV